VNYTTNDHLKSESQMRVELFMARMRDPRQAIPTAPTMPGLPVRTLRGSLMLEEVLECINLGLGLEVMVKVDGVERPMILTMDKISFYEQGPGDLEELAGNLADLDVVGPCGTASACGIAMKPIKEAVDGNNLLKFAPGHKFREDGKLVKPPDHPKIEPMIGDLLRQQGWNPSPETKI